MRCRALNLTTATVLVALCSAGSGQAELWRCVQPDGTVLFKDGGGAGCRELGTLPELQSTRLPTTRGAAELRPAQEPAASVTPADRKAGPQLSSRPFAPVSRTIPSLSYHDLSPAMRAKGWNLPNKGDITMVQIDVAYLPGGNGPYLTTDDHFKDWARQTLAVAVLAAAKATRFDPRYLAVRLTLPVGSMLHSGLRVDGPSAGVAWAVAVTSALLGDPLRPDVCLSGTIDSNLVVGAVGGVEHKIEGCHLLPQFREMLVPSGQKTFAITDKGMARSITVTEVATLAEAYEIITGQSLRPVP
ncbi:MAG TPA: S16 family serine protease [Nitrospira sp.]|nr:S16 family serine protease [Nitrospira sp.]